ncbi:MAG TPA: hypothetical protein VIJ27_03710 [Mucilaginibacter sp.]
MISVKVNIYKQSIADVPDSGRRGNGLTHQNKFKVLIIMFMFTTQ